MLTIAALLERDGPVCHLCGVEVDLSVHYNHPMAPTRDHVLALARRGTDTLDNLRIAHRSCNSKRKARKC